MDRYADTSTFLSSLDDSRRGRLFYVGHSLDVKSGHEYGGARRARRAVLAVLNRRVDEHQPSIAELIVLVSWMLAAVRYQDAAKVKRRRKGKAMRLHMIFPACSLVHGLLMIVQYTNRIIDPCLLFYAAC